MKDVLGDDATALAGALRTASYTATCNRFPGGRGAVLEEGAVESFGEPPVPDGSDAGEAILTIAIGHVDAMVGNWRSISGGRGDGLAPALARVAQLRDVAVATGSPWLAAYLRLVGADLHRLAGDRSTAEAELRAARDESQAAGDGPGVAAALVALGDWHAAPRSSPELLDLSIDATPPTDGQPDLAAAAAA